MKKLLGISLVAIMSVTAANAEIASKAYVNAEDTKITNTIGELSGLSQGITKTSVVAAINSVATNAGTDVSGLDSRLDVLEADDKTQGSVAKSIADALNAYTTTGNDATYARQSDFTKLQNDVRDQTTGLEATNTLAVANATAIAALDNTYATDTALTSGLATKQDTLTSAQLAAVDSGITSAKVSDYDAAVSAVNNASTGLAATKTIADANATAITTLNGDAQTPNSVDNKIATAQSTLQSAINAKADAATTLAGYGITDGVQSNTAITASLVNSIVQYDEKGLVVSGTPAGALATKSTVGRDDINANAVTLAKLSATLPSPCQQSGTDCVLKSSNGELEWEVIQR